MILEPSRGGKGIKLNNAKPTFIITTMTIIFINSTETRLYDTKMRPITAKIEARVKLVTGPANAIIPSANLLFFKLYGLYGTGLAQPKRIPEFVSNKMAGKKIEPKKSICFRGFKVKRPSYFAVGSPKTKATYP